VIVHVLILGGVISAAAALAVVVHRRRTRDEEPEYQSALTFVGADYGLLLGLLVVFAVGHFNDVRHESQGRRARSSRSMTRLVCTRTRRGIPFSTT
jgi:hypothetical protein